ncbi:MAG TPA: acyl carrier protein [Candidatus Kapabacteria bacterium]|nr:acyl carrier protein [Candidatus Kapabacteria bacterium]
MENILNDGHQRKKRHTRACFKDVATQELNMIAEKIRAILAQHARLTTDINTLSDASDLYDAGLTSLTTVNLMLAIEDQFDIEFPDHMLGRKTFGSIQALCEAVEELVG